MARVTVEDCLEHVDNRFQLVLLAAKRARQIARGSEPFVELENDKPTVVALREIAAGKVGMELLDEPEIDEFQSMRRDYLDLSNMTMPGEQVPPPATEGEGAREGS